MATIAHKSPLPGSAGMGMGGPRDYTSTISSARTLASSTAHNNSFASPTESEFSEVFDGLDTVKYVADSRGFISDPSC
jgi:mitogen-activated protein kinase kinase kinase